MRHPFSRVILALCVAGMLMTALWSAPARGQPSVPPGEYAVFAPLAARNRPVQSDPPLRNYLAIAHADGDIYTIRGDGSEATRLTSDPIGEYDGVFSPDGEYIAFLRIPPYGSTGPAEVRVMERDGSNQRVVDPVPLYNERGYLWSPVGSHLLVAGTTSPSGVGKAMYIVTVDGSVAPQLVATDFDVIPNTSQYTRTWGWSPDGRYIHYFRRVEQTYEHWVKPVSGGAARRLSVDTQQAFWHPDSSEMVFDEWDGTSDYSVGRLVAADGSSNRIVYTGTYAFVGWMEGGATLLLEDYSDTGNLATVSREGGAVTPFTAYPAGAQVIAIAPDGSTVFYHTRWDGFSSELYLQSLHGEAHHIGSLERDNLHAASATWAADGSGLLYNIVQVERLNQNQIIYLSLQNGVPGASRTLLESSGSWDVRFLPHSSRLGALDGSGSAITPPGPRIADVHTGELTVLEAPNVVLRTGEWRYLP